MFNPDDFPGFLLEDFSLIISIILLKQNAYVNFEEIKLYDVFYLSQG